MSEANEGYSFWVVWCRTFEGDRRWHMVRTPDTWDSDMVFSMASSFCRGGGVGGDAAEILEIECGYDDGSWNDYTDEEYNKI